MSAPAVIAKAMSERELDEGIRAIAEDLGLLRYHTWMAKNSPRGFPDLVLAGPAGHIFRELKTETGKLTTAQQEWIGRLTAGGADAGVWRPSDLLSGKVARELAAIAGLRVSHG